MYTQLKQRLNMIITVFWNWFLNQIYFKKKNAIILHLDLIINFALLLVLAIVLVLLAVMNN